MNKQTAAVHVHVKTHNLWNELPNQKSNFDESDVNL